MSILEALIKSVNDSLSEETKNWLLENFGEIDYDECISDLGELFLKDHDDLEIVNKVIKALRIANRERRVLKQYRQVIYQFLAVEDMEE